MNDTLALNHGTSRSRKPKSGGVNHQHRSNDLEYTGYDSKQYLLVGVPSGNFIVNAEA